MMTELKITDALKLGVEAHRAGKVQEADRYYTAILKVQPQPSGCEPQSRPYSS